MQLPEDCRLAYIVSHEAWYARSMPDRQPEMSVMAAAEDGRCAWEFTITEADFENRGMHPISVALFDDAFAAFAQIPEFFAALATGDYTTLDAVRSLLDGLGAADDTDRKGGEIPEKVTTGRIRKAIAAMSVTRPGPDGLVTVSAENAAEAVMRVLGADKDAR